MPIVYGSVCSGIEAATQAWHPLGMRAAWFAEIEPFPSAVLAHHSPDVPNHGDMTKLAALVLAGKIPAPDVLVGGTPCQASRSPVCAKASPTRAAPSPSNTWSLQMQLNMFAPASESPPASSSGRTSPASSATKGTPSDAFLARLLGKTESCSLQGKNGRTLVVCMDPKEQSRGGSWTPNISALPNGAVVCSLSQVLVTDLIPPRYFLSEKACAGILRRGEARRRTLPEQLLSALRSSAERDASTSSPSS
ncbi:hypothetical protein [Pseudomonas sp. 31 R 17]|nr:hypothetical protein [Pseudomonas sp. 31 R 17]